MVQLMKSGDFGADRGAASCGGDKLPVKLEIVEDPLEEEHGPLNKRSRGSSSLEQVRVVRVACLFFRENTDGEEER